MSTLAGFGLYLVLCAAVGLVQRGPRPYQLTATWQRARWRKLARKWGLVPTGAPGEFTGVWRGTTVVLGAHFAPTQPLVLEVRALGLMAPEETAAALCTRFAGWHHEVVDGELRVHVPFRGNSLHAEDLDAWLCAVRAAAQPAGSVYRG